MRFGGGKIFWHDQVKPFVEAVRAGVRRLAVEGRGTLIPDEVVVTFTSQMPMFDVSMAS